MTGHLWEICNYASNHLVSFVFAGILYIHINVSPQWVAKEKLAIQIRKSPEYICVEIHNVLK